MPPRFRIYYRFIIELGFTITNTCYPMSFSAAGNVKLDPVYGAVSDDAVVTFSSAEKVQLYRALFDVIPHFRSSIRIFTPRASLYGLMAEQRDERSRSFACRGGIDYYFIECREGNTYPCGFRGTESLGKFWEIDLKRSRTKPYCRLCDWECFRDPSTLLGPILERRSLSTKPFTTALFSAYGARICVIMACISSMAGNRHRQKNLRDSKDKYAAISTPQLLCILLYIFNIPKHLDQ